MPLRLIMCCSIAFSAAACATSVQNASRAAAGTAETRAVELGCPYTEPVDPARAPYKVSLEFRVQDDGQVDAASITVRTSRHNTDEQAFVERAREIARGCTYEPATVDGRPVETTVRKRFYFEG